MRQVKFIATALVVALSTIATPAALAADNMDITIEVGKPLKYLKPITDDKPAKLNGIADLTKDGKVKKPNFEPFTVAKKTITGTNYSTKPGDFIIAEKGSYVWAEKGSHVEAMAGSVVIAMGGTVTAHAGSRVDAYDGSKVIAKSGSTVVTENASLVTAEPGATVIVEIE